MSQNQTIDTYIKKFPPHVQEILQKIRTLIQELVPEAQEAISYAIPTFKLNGKYLIYFAGWKEHIAIYPIPRGTEAFQKAIAPYITGKGTVQFKLNESIPYDLIKKIVNFRLKEDPQNYNK